METGRSDMEGLRRFLTKVSHNCEDREELTNLTERGLYMAKISK
jgi:hypothetical protein